MGVIKEFGNIFYQSMGFVDKEMFIALSALKFIWSIIHLQSWKSTFGASFLNSAATPTSSLLNNFQTVFLAPDQTPEQRVAHSKLVIQMKEMVKNYSSKHYFIKDDKVKFTDEK